MKKLISLVLIICALFALISCNSNSEWQKAEHTYSQLGLPVTHFFNKVSDVLDFYDIHISSNCEFYIIFAIVTLLFYATYFISKKCRKGEKN